jgi:hypothetical protein
MSNRVRFRRSATAGAAPVIGTGADYGRIALNLTDRKVYAFDPAGNPVLMAYRVGDHDPARAYRIGDVAVFGNAVYRAIANINPKPFTPGDWQALGDYRDQLVFRSPTAATQSRITLPAALSLDVRANASQSADLQTWTRADGTVISAIDAQGYPSGALGRTVFRVSQVAHGFTLVGQAVRFDGANWVLANAATAAGFATAVVRRVIDANAVELVTDGIVTGLAGGAFVGGYAANTLYYCSTTTPGQLTSTAPPDPANANPVLRTTSGNAAVLLIGAPPVAGGGVSATATETIVTQTPNPFTAVGEVAAHDGADWVLANPAVAARAPLGIIKATAGSTFTVVTGGIITGLSGLTPGQAYYSDATGGLTDTPPTNSVQGAAPVLWALTATSGIAMPGLPPPTLLRAAQNLADLANAGTARTNLGLGTIATQASSAVSITGGTITGITDLAVADGGTGASDAASARTNLGLGTIATQASSAVSITGGTITGITDLAVADGGTGASTAPAARTNLGLGTIATQGSNAVAITGGTISGVTISSLASDLAVADGGTGASNAAGARTNLGAAASTITISAGTGLTGGGNLTANRTLSLEGQALAIHNLGSNGIVVRTGAAAFAARTITGGDGIDVTNGTGAAGNPTLAVDSSVVRTSRNLTAGNGLTGGGNLAGDRTFTLGTPSAITDSSTNSVTSTSHTHSLSSNAVRALMAASTVGLEGTYAFLRGGGFNTGFTRNSTYAGSGLRYSGITSRSEAQNAQMEVANSDAPSGTWRAMGTIGAVASRYSVTLFLRIA